MEEEKWEQRRFEIARDMLCAFQTKSIGYDHEDYENAVTAADELIKQLKETKNV